MTTKKKNNKKEYNWFLHLTEQCPSCGYLEAYAYSKKEQEESSYPDIFDEKFTTKKELNKYCKENNIDLVS